MRERLVAAFVGLTVLVIVMFGVPRAYLVADQVRSQQERDVSRSVELIARVLGERAVHDERVTSAYLHALLQEGERVEYISASGRLVVAGPALGTADDLRESQPLPVGGRVTLSRSGALVEDRVAAAILPLVALGLLLIVVAGGLGLFLAGRLSRPFRELADLARRLGRGRFDLDVPHYSVPEAEQIGSALRSSGTELEELVRREREFAANASHQLRTPITALRLELEDLGMWPQTPPEVSTELTRSLRELDRLSTAVTDLLDLARSRRLAGVDEFDLTALVTESVERWKAPAAKTGRAVEHHATRGVITRTPPGPVAQILDVLIDNSLKHGRGRVIVETADLGTHLQLQVSDEGTVSSTMRERLFRRHVGSGVDGEGIGLALAAEIAEGLGGHLTLAERANTTFDVVLPRASSPSRLGPASDD